MNPLVSVIIPTHDRSDLVERAINSVLNQTYQNIEILIVDDVGNAEKFKQLSPKIKYIKIPFTKWVSENRNAGIKAAQGKYIAGMDDDDTWLSHHIESLVSKMELDSSIGFSCSQGYIVNNYNDPLSELMFPTYTKEMCGNLFSKMIWDCFTQPSLMLVRKDLFDIVGYYKNINGEDLDMIMRLAVVTNIYYDPKPVGVWYWRHDMSSASTTTQSSLENRLKVLFPAIDCLTNVERMAHDIGRKFSYTERFALYFQKYYFWFYIAAVYFMFRDKDKYKILINCIKLYPHMTLITLLAPLCQIKFIRDVGQDIKRRLL